MSGSFHRAAPLAGLVLVALSCDSGPRSVDDRVYACASNDDCGEGYACAPDGVCVPPEDPSLDGGARDAGAKDAGASDSGRSDAGDAGGDAGPDASTPDASTPDASTPDAGGDGGSGAPTCRSVEDVITPTAPNAGLVLLLDGRPRILYQLPNVGAVYYVECLTGCDGPDAGYSSPLELGQTMGPHRPAFKEVGGVLTATWYAAANGAVLHYAECDGNCTVRANWDVIRFPHGVTAGLLGLASAPTRRAFAGVTDTAAGYWAECSTGCALDAGNWTRVTPTGAQNVLGAGAVMGPGGAGFLRRAYFGQGIRVFECLGGGCPDSPSPWDSLGTLDAAGFQPRALFDRAGNLHVFTRDDVVGELRVYSCRGGDCVDAGFTSRSAYRFAEPQGRNYDVALTSEGRLGFVTFSPTFILIGEEEADGGFTTRFPTLCDGGSLEGTDPSGYEEQDGGWTVLYRNTATGLRLYRERR